MRQFQGKRRTRQLLYSKPVLLVLLIIVGLLGQAVWKMYVKNQFTQTERAKAEAELSEATAKKDGLARTVSTLETEAGVDAAIREKFPVSKQGEYVVTIVGDDTKPTTTPPAPKPWWRKWF